MDYKEELAQYQQENKLLRELATRHGFFQYYFDQLPKHRTTVECFNQANDLHLDLFGEYKYESIHSFRRSLSYYRKSNKK